MLRVVSSVSLDIEIQPRRSMNFHDLSDAIDNEYGFNIGHASVFEWKACNGSGKRLPIMRVTSTEYLINSGLNL